MTNKTTMLEPVAFLNPYGGVLLKPETGLERRTFNILLITTTQAEAYKDACVREALEEAAMILKANAEACHSDTRIMLRANAEAILSLIKRIA